MPDADRIIAILSIAEILFMTVYASTGVKMPCDTCCNIAEALYDDEVYISHG